MRRWWCEPGERLGQTDNLFIFCAAGTHSELIGFSDDSFTLKWAIYVPLSSLSRDEGWSGSLILAGSRGHDLWWHINCAVPLKKRKDHVTIGPVLWNWFCLAGKLLGVYLHIWVFQMAAGCLCLNTHKCLLRLLTYGDVCRFLWFTCLLGFHTASQPCCPVHPLLTTFILTSLKNSLQAYVQLPVDTYLATRVLLFVTASLCPFASWIIQLGFWGKGSSLANDSVVFLKSNITPAPPLTLHVEKSTFVFPTFLQGGIQSVRCVFVTSLVGMSSSLWQRWPMLNIKCSVG